MQLVRESKFITPALDIPLTQLSGSVECLAAESQQRPLIVYCQRGISSLRAASLLQAGGCTAVRDLIGGYDAWLAAEGEK